ncbi:23S rRNA pseudouridine(1911/1915/1917) synthase RluD [Psychrobium sp. 1_MG-2023]|uniref:23S rRNA pseudouridine(1911/1915/1917) synthase RluD n=1 Tax=Psychrobium sp. 1_MG-2023 TaxID=3062624 RepID=UPI000C332444|nr:23S rRNA pseudouridine(1911/1915/1917) synthase RluD [Psychrobium sp. 1_MG-2023]MDP2561858.1 23S rRNA pseudouridine(1911/1915/1917) synthase RluD [Psychrobium sp. 1_MG-2023]PKF55774.1 23S rRNA pseudouridine(1911/1915/1917) synthase RluD [Alteromonadales bacterium alter-6D02]
MNQAIQLSATVSIEQCDQRLDQAIAELFSDYSRSRLKEWILAGYVSVDGQVVTKARAKVLGEELIEIDAIIEIEERHKPEPIDLNIVYEDEHILVINKPAGLVVHPGAGNPDGTVLNALLNHFPEIESVPRAGIVHRLDKDTTGLMVVAKTIPAQTKLVAMIQKRNIIREYEAIAIGQMTAGGKIEAPIARHATKRTHMAVDPEGKEAITRYRIAEKFRAHTRLRLRLETGRTHQIRVHMSYMRHALLGDPVYGGRPRPIKHSSEELIEAMRGFKRQALHAIKLQLEHPITGELMRWQAPVPEDMQRMTELLRQDTLDNQPQ